jgi:hypothetical protein
VTRTVPLSTAAQRNTSVTGVVYPTSDISVVSPVVRGIDEINSRTGAVVSLFGWMEMNVILEVQSLSQVCYFIHTSS